MQNDLENLLKLLQKSFDTNDLNELQNLEKEINRISSNIKKVIDSSGNNDQQFKKSEIENLENLIRKISLKQKNQKKFLSEFQSFINNRKIN